MAVASPGIILNLAAEPGTGQAGLVGHYAWPILPWLFVAAVVGVRYAPIRHPRMVAVYIIAITFSDLALPRVIIRTPWKMTPDVTQVLNQLARVPSDAAVVAQPNLIPHLPRRMNVYGLGVYTEGQPLGEYVLLTTAGDLWPFDRASLTKRIGDLAADPRYEQISDGPLFVFRRR